MGTRNEKHKDNCRKTPRWVCSLPIGIKGIVAGQGDTFEEAPEDVKPAICTHVETFDRDVVDDGGPASGVFLTEAQVAI